MNAYLAPATHSVLDESLTHIAELLQRHPELHLPTLIQGNAGIGLFFAYLYQYRPREEYLEACATQLEQAIEAVSTSDQTPFLATGFLGLGWVVAHLIRQGVLDEEAEEVLDAIRPAIVTAATTGPISTTYDLLYGFLGASVFFSEHADADYGAPQRAILAQLRRQALPVAAGTAWTNSSDPTDRSFNLGLAHGIPSVVVVLLQLRKQGYDPAQCELLIRGAIRFVLAQEKATGHSLFATSVEGAKPLATSRLAWCHGDLGVALMLLLAGTELQDPDLRHKGLEVARHAAGRPLASSGVSVTEGPGGVDVGFCHGTAGIALLFLRLHQLTGDELLGQTARYWLELTLTNLTPRLQELSAAFWIKEFDGESPDLEQRYGVLEGIAGVGLTLLAFANPEKADWTRLFLLAL
ncbi:lanthionine synthetase C family protein [Hymenobacter persicinus]|uniref:Lanthionine synthetase n=1 Tax=Hymenobacter persicinus TaxID=2025506 RepID=A0A4V1ZB40_9BACT|nr:lanthionine synthetase C family protein [Hymenobacter persicinus]RYU82783.1 hypothetical protein EWM57_03585 [Hymenobacter persicinus]